MYCNGDLDTHTKFYVKCFDGIFYNNTDEVKEAFSFSDSTTLRMST